MRLDRIWLNNFRSYETFEIELDPGTTVLVGPNGVGKTNLLEAIALVATLKSFRGSQAENLVRRDHQQAIIRALGERGGREVLIEVELAKGRVRAQVNKQRLERTRDLLGALRVTVFAPDDLRLVKEGPSVRRDFLDDLVVAIDPRKDQLLVDFAKVLRQRNALLKQAPTRIDELTESTLEVWDEQFARLGESLLQARYDALSALIPLATDSYRKLADNETSVVTDYRTSWPDCPLLEALTQSRSEDLKRRVTTVGPHRDDVVFLVDGFSSRSEVSQGEQRTLALALRLAAHRLVAERVGESPLLLLDDVLSELDPDRARNLLNHLPPGQTIITSASGLPGGSSPDRVLMHDGHTVSETTPAPSDPE